MNIDRKKDDEHEPEMLRDLLEDVGTDFTLPAAGTELILMEIDPNRAHVCWTIDPSQARPFHPLVLRVYDVTASGAIETAEQMFDVEVFGLQGRWYLDLWRDDRVFIAEIGYHNADGSFRSLARSNEVRTPPAEPEVAERESNHSDPNGKPLHTDWPGDKVQEPAQDAPVQPAVESNADEEANAPTQPQVVEPITILDPEFPVADWPVLPVDEHAEVIPSVENLVSPVDAESGDRLADAALAAGDAAVAFDEDVMQGGGEDFPSAQMLQDAHAENHDALKAYYEAAAHMPGVESAPAEMGGHAGDPSSAAPAASPPPSSQPAPLEQIVGLSSMEQMGKDVLLEVNAELHIYGRAKPNTELSLYGQVVKTRPDGSFSVRRPLPHGAVVLPLLYTKNT